MTERPAGSPRPLPPRASAGPRLPAGPRPSRPDPRPLRFAIGLGGLAAASGILTALLPPVPNASPASVVSVEAPQPSPSVLHVTRYVRLAPGQTAPPKAAVQQLPAPTPRRVVVTTTTRQSGKP